jgi:hypothetical protein
MYLGGDMDLYSLSGTGALAMISPSPAGRARAVTTPAETASNAKIDPKFFMMYM